MSSVIAGFGAIAQNATFEVEKCSQGVHSLGRVSVEVGARQARKPAGQLARAGATREPALPGVVVDSKVFIEAGL